MAPDCGSNTRCRSASAVDLPAPVGPTSAIVSPGCATRVRSRPPGGGRRRRTKRRRTRPARARGRDRPRRAGRAPPARCRARSKNSRSARRVDEHALTKPTTCSSRAMTMPVKLVKMTISPMVARPCTWSPMPTRKIDSIVSVVEARVRTAAIAHQDSTGICAPSSRADDARAARDLRLDAGVALHQRDVTERVGCPLREARSSGPRPSSAGLRPCARRAWSAR